MNRRTALVAAIAAFSISAGSIASAASPQLTTGWFANRIAGAYQSEAHVRPCGSTGPFQTVINTILFNYGGTALAVPPFPPGGAGGYSRTIDVGAWSYNPLTNVYSVRLRFYSFVNGAFTGTNLVERELKMSIDGKSVSGPVHVTTYALDNTVTAEVCGTATSTRL